MTHLDFQGIFPADSRAFAQILSDGHQLESLRLECILECTASAQFREHAQALPFLHHFAFSLMGYRVNDHDLFPAISDFLKGRAALRSPIFAEPVESELVHAVTETAEEYGYESVMMDEGVLIGVEVRLRLVGRV